ncbi:hypothetical protein Thi970DRAFT_03367, partial [Thiorhodovibrio frisius]
DSVAVVTASILTPGGCGIGLLITPTPPHLPISRLQVAGKAGSGEARAQVALLQGIIQAAVLEPQAGLGVGGQHS